LSDQASGEVPLYTRRGVLAAGAAAGGGLAAGAVWPSPTRANPPSAPRLAGGSDPGPFLLWPDHPHYSYELLRTVGKAASRGADFGESYIAAKAIGDVPADAAFTVEFQALGRALLDRASSLRRDDPIAARALALRASEYLRLAEFFITPHPPFLQQKIDLYRTIRSTFALATAGTSPRVEAVQVPYEGTALYAYYVHPRVSRKGSRHPAVIFFGGLDSTGEEAYLWIADELTRRGIAVLIVDGPGHGASLRFRNITTRTDYEVAAKAAVDYLRRRGRVDPRRIGLIGVSLGGYYAARSAAFEHRIRATVVWGAIWDVPAIRESQHDPETLRYLTLYGLWVYGGEPVEAIAKSQTFKLEGVADKIRNPIYIIHGEADSLVPVEQAYELYEAVSGPKVLNVVPKGTAGSAHCQADSLPAAWEAFVPWLEDELRHPA
jgi:dipeptidyl aminopeptidase/acylaminoacyl peptidase